MPEPVRVITTDAEIDAAIRQARVFERYDRRVTRVTYSERSDRFVLHMDNGTIHMIPRALLQGLAGAAPADLQKIELLGGGTGLYWPALDVAHYVPGLLAGVYGSAKWMKHLQESQRRRSRVKGANLREFSGQVHHGRRNADLSLTDLVRQHRRRK
jgi:hypothetical protein